MPSSSNVEGKVELLGVVEGNFREQTVLVSTVDEFAVDAVLLIRCLPLGIRHCHRGGGFTLTGGGVAQDDGIEGAVFTADGDHAVGGGGIVVNGIAGVEDLRAAADLNFQMAADDDVTFLTLVGDQLDILVFRTLTVFGLHIKRKGDTVAEVCGQVVADHMVGFLDALAFTLAGQVVGAQLGAAAFQQVTHVNAEAQGTAVQEGDA